MPAKVDEAEVHTAGKTANEADAKADEADTEANRTNKLDALAVAKGRAEGRAKGHVVANGLGKGHVLPKGRADGYVVAEGHVVSVDCVNDGFLYSLMKYSTTFAEVDGYFRIHNDQLGTVDFTKSKEIWSKLCSLRR